MMRGRKVVLDDEHDELGGDIVMDLFELTPAEINTKLDCNTITFKNPVAHKDPMHSGEFITQPNDTEIVRLWHRDRKRYNHAVELERTSGRWSSRCATDMIHIQLSGSNVCKTSEIVTLLHYLRENLIYGQGVHHMEPRGNTGLHDVKSWHVTAQEHVTGAMFFSFRRCRVSRCARHTC